MTAPSFPQLAPSAHPVVVMPIHPHVAKRSTGGGETRIKLSNVRAGARLKISFTLVNSATELLPFIQHWQAARGTAREFTISAVNLGAIGSTGRLHLLSTTWKYASPPKCTDICGGLEGGTTGPPRLIHDLEIELVSQPRRVAAYINTADPRLSLPAYPVVIPGARL